MLQVIVKVYYSRISQKRSCLTRVFTTVCGEILGSNTTLGLTHTGALSERHEGAEDAVDQLGAVLYGEAPLQLQRALVVHHPGNGGVTNDKVRSMAKRQKKKKPLLFLINIDFALSD